MIPYEPVRTIHVLERPSRLATLRDLAAILRCAAILLGTVADLLLRVSQPHRVAPAAAASVSR
jgi:hypothetical protein